MPVEINLSNEKERIVEFIRAQIAKYEFEGAVIGISGGVDSAVVGKLLTEALGRERSLVSFCQNEIHQEKQSRILCWYAEVLAFGIR